MWGEVRGQRRREKKLCFPREDQLQASQHLYLHYCFHIPSRVQEAINSLPFMDPESSPLCSQKCTTGSYAEPEGSSPHPVHLISTSILSAHPCLVYLTGHFYSYFLTIILHDFSFPMRAMCVSLILLDFVTLILFDEG